jgi:hypothetical protein
MEYLHYSPILIVTAGVLLALLVLRLTTEISRRRGVRPATGRVS